MIWSLIMRKRDKRRVTRTEPNNQAYVLAHNGYYRAGEFIPFSEIRKHLESSHA